ncbi:substrate-binding domain-containing protein [Candidatus Pacearchaeota archaeon]|nr:substrate-binding domain-containing protein [Candidatus Pacearchaeota archaeon]
MNRKPVIGLVMKSLQADFFQNMKMGALEFAQKRTDFELITVGTDNQTDIDKQIALIESFIQQKVDALVVIPIDSKALVPVVVKAVKAGIKLVNIDIKLDPDLLQEYGVDFAYVGPDNENAAKLVGDVLSKKLGKGANVIIIEGLQVAENAIQRKNGFLKSISEYGLNLLACGVGDWETHKAETVFASLYEKFGNIDGVLCCNDAMALGVLKVLEEDGKIGKIQVVGFDNDDSVQPDLENGKLLATIDAHGSQMAVQGIEFVLNVINGAENRGVHSTKFDLILSKTL